MTNTYIINGSTYISAKTSKQAKVVFSRTRNEKIETCKLCKD